VPLFAALRDDELAAAAPLFSVYAYPRNAIVVSEGEAVTTVLVVLAGRTRHFWRDDEGQEMDLVVLGPGEAFGLTALIGESMQISSIAVEPLVLATIKADEFEALMTRFPRLAVQVLKYVIWTVRNLIERAKVFSMEGVYGRVVWLLKARRARRRKAGLSACRRPTSPDALARRRNGGPGCANLAHGGYIARGAGATPFSRATAAQAPPRAAKQLSEVSLTSSVHFLSGVAQQPDIG
jgi:CRP-like cAMP-binding protein